MTKSEFKQVFDHAKKINQRSMLMLITPNQTPVARLGVIIGKRVANRAVDRHRFKRVMKESFRLNQKRLGGWDIVIIARQSCQKETKLTLRKGIEDLWDKLLKHYPNSCSS